MRAAFDKRSLRRGGGAGSSGSLRKDFSNKLRRGTTEGVSGLVDVSCVGTSHVVSCTARESAGTATLSLHPMAVGIPVERGAVQNKGGGGQRRSQVRFSSRSRDIAVELDYGGDRLCA